MRSSRSAPAKTEPRFRYRPQMAELEDEFFKPVIAILTMRRMMLGLSQEQLNFTVGCADGHLAKWEAGIFRPSAYYLLLWCKALNYRLQLAEIQ